MEWSLWQAAGQEAKLLNWLRELDYVNELGVFVCVRERLVGRRSETGRERPMSSVMHDIAFLNPINQVSLHLHLHYI